MAQKSDDELFGDGESRLIGTDDVATCEAERSAGVNGKAGDAEPKAPDPFDPESLRLTQVFQSIVGGERVLLTVPVRKPSKEHWVRVHPSHRLDTAVIELREDSETYLLDRELVPIVTGEPTLRFVTLFVAITREGNVFLWPVPLPPADGRDNEWHRSAREIAALAVDRWVRITSSRSLGAYEANTARIEIPEPKWPNKSFRDLLALAFRDRRIDSADHPVLKRLRGDA